MSGSNFQLSVPSPSQSVKFDIIIFSFKQYITLICISNRNYNRLKSVRVAHVVKSIQEGAGEVPDNLDAVVKTAVYVEFQLIERRFIRFVKYWNLSQGFPKYSSGPLHQERSYRCVLQTCVYIPEREREIDGWVN